MTYSSPTAPREPARQFTGPRPSDWCLSRPAPRTRLAAGLIGAVGVLAACDPGTRPESTPPAITPETMQQYVTAGAAANLDAGGHWKLAEPNAKDRPQITRRQAEALAELWPIQFGPWIHRQLESEHGASIDLKALARCGVTYYAASPYQPLDAATASNPATEAAQRAFGPWWLVTLCSAAGTPQLSVGVAGYAIELGVKGGEIVMPRFPKMGGEWFSVEGIPRSASQEFLEAPERAVQRLALASGLRVAAVPELIVPDHTNGFPNRARWRLKLESPAFAVGQSGRALSSDEYYSWLRPGAQRSSFVIPAASQPPGLTFRYVLNATTAGPDEPLVYAEGFLPRRAHIPTAFEPVTLGEGN